MNYQQSATLKTNFKTQTITKYYPWVVILFSAAFLLYKYILQVSPSVMTNELMRVFHIDAAGLGNLTATFFYAYLVTQLFVGILLDKFSVRLLTGFAILVAAVGAWLFAAAQHLWLAEIARALIGMGAAFATVSYMKMTAVWFDAKRFAFVGGLLATAAMLGALFGEAPLALLVTKVGWQHALNYCGILGVVIAVAYLFIVRDKPSDNQSSDLVTSLNIKDFLVVLKNKNNWLLMFYSGLAFSPVAVFGGLWGNPFLEHAYLLSKTQAASLSSMVFVGLALGGPILGWFADRLHDRKLVMYVGTSLALVSLLVAIYLPILPIWMLGFLLFLFGFGTGSFMLSFAVGRDINALVLAATVVSLLNTGDAVMGAVTDPLVGYFLDLGWQGNVQNDVHVFSTQDFHQAFILLPIYLLFSVILLKFINADMKD